MSRHCQKSLDLGAEHLRQQTRKLGLNVSQEMARQLKALSQVTDIPQSRLLRRALELLFERYEIKGQPDTEIPPRSVAANAP